MNITELCKYIKKHIFTGIFLSFLGDMATFVYFGLGSNLGNELGDCVCHLKQAVLQLSALGDFKVSGLYKSVPMGPTDQPDYFNAVVQIKFSSEQTISYSPKKLLAFTQNIEKNGHRKKQRHWGERSIDVDILLYGEQVVHDEELIIPHIGILERNFVAIPLLELNSDIKIGNQALNTHPIVKDVTGIQLVATDWL